MRVRIAVLPLLASALMLPAGQASTVRAASSQVQQDPAVGPHARDEARHKGDHLAFTAAQSTPIPRRMASAATAAAQPGAAATPSNEALRREVLGFAPYWAVSTTSSAYTNWNYSLLSTVAFFGLTLNGDGSFQTTDQGYAAWNSAQLVDMINRAHAARDRVVLVIKVFDSNTICSVVNDGAANAISNTISAVKLKQLDGVNVDFEGSNVTPCPNGQSLQSGLTRFMGQLSSAMHSQVPGSYVTIDTYSGAASWDSGEFKIGDLSPVVDAMFVMGYDMNFSNLPNQAGPTAPLNGWQYNDSTAVQQYLSKAPASKIILGVPYYGYKWSTTSNQPYATTSGAAEADTYVNEVADLACTHAPRQWDGTASSWWIAWPSPAANDPCGANLSSWRELYYDDAQSLGLKYDLVNNSGLRGTGMWTLDYQGTSTDLWNEISLKFVSHWEALSGTLASGPEAASWGPNRLDAFMRGTDNALWHRYWDGNGWQWERLGGVISAEPGAVSTAAVTPNTGRIDVFVRGQEMALWHRVFDGSGWGPWEYLGGVLGSGPAVSSSNPGQLDVFVRGSDGALWHRAYGSNGWAQWLPVGGKAIFTEKPAAVSAGGHTDVFVRGTDQALWHCSFDGTSCGNWQTLGGPILNGPGASTWGSARLDVFVRGSDSHLWHRWFDGSAWSQWSNEIGVGAILTSGPSAVSPSAGRLDLFIRGTDYQLWHLGINIY